MQTQSKEFQGVFTPLNNKAIERLTSSETKRDAYLDGISYMQDMVAPFIDSPYYRVFDATDALIDCNEIRTFHFQNKDDLSKNFSDNFEVATYFAHQADSTLTVNNEDSIQVMKKDASAFNNALLQTYNFVRALKS